MSGMSIIGFVAEFLHVRVQYSNASFFGAIVVSCKSGRLHHGDSQNPHFYSVCQSYSHSLPISSYYFDANKCYSVITEFIKNQEKRTIYE